MCFVALPRRFLHPKIISHTGEKRDDHPAARNVDINGSKTYIFVFPVAIFCSKFDIYTFSVAIFCSKFDIWVYNFAIFCSKIDVADMNLDITDNKVHLGRVKVESAHNKGGHNFSMLDSKGSQIKSCYLCIVYKTVKLKCSQQRLPFHNWRVSC
jgi:hypothetical protein